MKTEKDKDIQMTEDELDTLLHEALAEVVKKEADEFMALDVTDIEKDPKFEKELLRTLKRQAMPSWKRYLRTAAVACILLVSMLFSACMLVPQVRQVLGETMIEFYDKYITLNFRPDTDAPPTELEKRASTSYLPHGYYGTRRAEENDYTDTLVYSTDGELMFTFAQFTMYLTDIQYGFDVGDTLTKVYINGHIGTLIHYPDGIYEYALIWSDGVYQYSLCGSFESTEELLKIADGVTLSK